MRTLLLLIMTALPAGALAQTTFKCVDEQKRVTYSNTACEKQGLKDAGPVADRIVTLPTVEVRKPAARAEPARAPSPRAADDAEVQRGGALKPVLPQLERLAK